MRAKSAAIWGWFRKAAEDSGSLIGRVNRLVQWRGIHFGRGPDPLIGLLESHGVTLVLDVGANVGQYARDLRLLGYDRRIVSFEPASATFASLARNAERDLNRRVVQIALGSEEGLSTLNLYENSALNSTRALIDLERWNESNPLQESVPVERLDAIFDALVSDDDRVFLKIDTQGSERAVLDGASGVLDRIAGVQLEVSFRGIYEGEPLMAEMLEYLEKRGFTLMYMMPLHHMLGSAWRQRDASLISQADAVFFRLGAS